MPQPTSRAFVVAHSPSLPSTCARVRFRDRDVDVDVSAYVLGTAHIGRSSATDVARVIREINPHVVVLELDEERADGLIARFARDGDGALASASYGLDLITGLREAKRANALTILGDTRARSIARDVARAVKEGDWKSLERWRECSTYARDALGFGTGRDGRGVNVVGALLERPEMLAPLVAPALAFAGVSVVMASAGATSSAASVVDLATFVFAAALFCPIVETLWMARDDVIVENARNGIACAAGIESGTLRRVRFDFTADASATLEAARMFVPRDNETPCFTLKRALAAQEIRRLNLWEPRWLALMDSLAEANGGALEGAELGCLLGRSRHYCRRESDSIGDDDVDVLARTGTVVVENKMRRARVIRSAEGQRPTTRARKLEVWIEGLDEEIDVFGLESHPAGYLLASGAPSKGNINAGDGDDVLGVKAASGDSESRVPTEIRCVCVVGLAHVNGVRRRLLAGS